MFWLQHRHSCSTAYKSPEKLQAKPINFNLFQSKRHSSELKQHQKTKTYANSRTYLIQNTKKAIQSGKNQALQKPRYNNICDHHSVNLVKHKDIFNPTQPNLTTREARKAAFANLRRKIWKSNDIATLIKAQQEKLFQSKEDLFILPEEPVIVESNPCIRRYNDSFFINFRQANFITKNDRNKDRTNNGTSKNTKTRISFQNPQKLQTTTISCPEIEEIPRNKSSVKSNINKFVRTNYSNRKVVQNKRSNTVGNLKKEQSMEDSGGIRPW